MNRKIRILAQITVATVLVQVSVPLIHTSAQEMQQNKEQTVLVVYKNQEGKNTVLKNSKNIERQFESVPAVSAKVDQTDIANLKNNPNIADVEPNVTIKLQDFPSKVVKVQTTTVTNGQDSQWDIQDVQAPQAWQAGLTGKGIKVGVIDSGIAPHSDLNVAGGVSEVSYTTSYADDNGHGTHVAGTIGATGNGMVQGVAPDVQLYAIKVMDSTGTGTLQDIIAGLDWAIQNNMDIVNLSLGTDTDSPLLHNMIDEAFNRGILLVASAGNNGNATGTGDTIMYPAKYSSAISVGSIDQDLNRSSFSATGQELEVSAPGSDILSTYLNNGYAIGSGTSMAAPHVAGVLALLKQKYPSMTNIQLRQELDKDAKDLGIVGKDTQFGYGLAEYPAQVTVQPAPQPGNQTVSFDSMFVHTAGNGIWTSPYGDQGANYVGDTTRYAGKVVHISSETRRGDVLWCFVNVNGQPIGWVDSRVLENVSTVNDQDVNQLVKSTTGNGVWSVPYGVQGSSYVGSTNNYVGKVIKLVQKISLNNVVWYQFSVDNQVIGWVDGRVLSDVNGISDSNRDAVMGATSINSIWSMPYGVPGAEYLGSTDLYAYRNITILNTTTYHNTLWDRISMDGKVMGWIDDNALDTLGVAKAENFDVTIGSTYNNGVWSTPYGTLGAQYLGSTNDYMYQTVHVVMSVQKGNTLWYQIQKGGKFLGWIDAGKVLIDLTDIQDENQTALMGYSGKGDAIWNIPYGEYGAKFVNLVDQYSYQTVQVVKSAKKGQIVWNEISIGGNVIGWVDANNIYTNVTNVQSENRTAFVVAAEGNAVWTAPYGEHGASYVGPASNYINKPLQLIRSLDIGGVHWYQFKVDNHVEGWIDSRAISGK
ncbi:GW domain-containing glycosaminoglycan-binding protein [Ectobacillus polymachus]|uniref:GW domain-containing glycosaminoglycan-binding protein n=1 Tax=Ectobacillus polymachus TaxID=1508806 RepID=UPI003A893CB4